MIYVAVALALLVVFIISRTAIVIPQQTVFVVERLGKYSETLDAGFHILLPFVDKIRYRHSLKEIPIDAPAQSCVTKDNVVVQIDGVIFLKVLDPRLASYGVDDYIYAVTQLAQTALRNEVGKIELDNTFEARDLINLNVVKHLDAATEAWGIKVLRFEIQNIHPPKEILSAMEEQAKAERTKRAAILKSEGERDAAINQAEGYKQKIIKDSEATQTREINEANGQAEAILTIAKATADGLREVGAAATGIGGAEAIRLKIAEQYLESFGKLAKSTNTMILPANVSDLGSMVALATGIVNDVGSKSRRSAEPGHNIPPLINNYRYEEDK